MDSTIPLPNTLFGLPNTTVKTFFQERAWNRPYPSVKTQRQTRRALVYDGLAQGAESYRISQWLASE